MAAGSKTKVYVANIDAVKVGASSLPVRIYMDIGPDQDITVHIALVENTDLDGKVTLSTSSV